MIALRWALVMPLLTAVAACGGGEAESESRTPGASPASSRHSDSHAPTSPIAGTTEPRDTPSALARPASSTQPSSPAVTPVSSTTVTTLATPPTERHLNITDPRTCEDPRDDGLENYELFSHIARSDDTLLVTASYLGGPSADRDVFVTFILGDSVYAVVLQKFADDTAGAYLVDLDAGTEQWLEGAYIYTMVARVSVPYEQLVKLNGEVPAFSPVLTVGGLDVDSCSDYLY
jgi:hypothetical protein